MMKRLAAAVAATGIAVLFSASVYASPEIGKKEGKPCTSCHTAAGKKDLNDAGKCYKEKKSLKDCGGK